MVCLKGRRLSAQEASHFNLQSASKVTFSAHLQMETISVKVTGLWLAWIFSQRVTGRIHLLASAIFDKAGRGGRVVNGTGL